MVCVVSSAIRNCNHVAIPIMAQHAKHLCDNPCIRRFVLTFHVRRLHLHATLLLLQPSPGQERQWSQHPFIHAASTPTTPTLGLAGHNTTRSCSPGHAQTPGGAFACDVLYGAHSQPEFVVEPHLFLALVMERLRLPLDITDARCEKRNAKFSSNVPRGGWQGWKRNRRKSKSSWITRDGQDSATNHTARVRDHTAGKIPDLVAELERLRAQVKEMDRARRQGRNVPDLCRCLLQI